MHLLWLHARLHVLRAVLIYRPARGRTRRSAPAAKEQQAAGSKHESRWVGSERAAIALWCLAGNLFAHDQAADSKFLDERDDITEYVRGLKAGEGLDESAIRAGYQRFKDEKAARELSALSTRHGLRPALLQGFVDTILRRRIFDGEQLTELLAPLGLGWKARTQKELELMKDLVPLLKKRAGGRDISGLKAYEE